jgi:aminoglycoside phosphotransferase (APT) family kinase protein
MDSPPADIAVDAPLVAKLIRTQHPDLDGALTLVANGWDNAIYRLGDDLCVRVPRRQIAVELVHNEQKWLPVLARRITVPIPVPVRVGVPSDDFPWPWTICRWYRGRPAVDVPTSQRVAVAASLAEFMTQLHVPAPPDAPHNPFRGVPLAARADSVLERLASGHIPRADELRAAWDRLAATPPWDGPPLWLHGDPHPANLLLREAHDLGRLSAVLDFGDLTAGDPASDLAAAWLVFDADGRTAFRRHLDGVDPDTWDRARAWGIVLGTAFAMHSGDNPRMAAIAAHVIEQVLTDSPNHFRRARR